MASLKDTVISGSLRVTDTIFVNNESLTKLDCSWLRVINNSSNNTDDAMVYLETKTSNDWALKIDKGSYSAGFYIVGTGTQLLNINQKFIIDDAQTYIKNTLILQNNGTAPCIWFRGASNTKSHGYIGIVWNNPGSGDLFYDARCRFCTYSYNSSSKARLDYYEYFDLPVVTAGLTANQAYSILTTKNTVTVGQGGTGTTTFASGELLIGNGTSAIGTRQIINNTSVGVLGWVTSATTASNLRIVNVNTLAYWNGAYNNTNSNLTYCVKGAFGNACTYAVDDATANGALGTGTGLTTERSVYYGLVTVNNASQTRATGIYAPTSAGTANQILVSVGGTSAPTWKATASGAAYATSSNGALTFGTLPIAQGGTGTSTAPTQWGIIYASSTTAYASTEAGTAGYLLQSNATSAPSWIQATDANTGSTIVKRDASGNFSAGTITASLSGNATTATTASYLSAPNEAGIESDQYGNFKHKRSTNTDYWQIQNSAGTTKFSVYPETGKVVVTGDIVTASGGRVGGSGGALYLGNSDNSNWVLTQDICSHTGSGDTYWSARANGTGHFKSVYGAVWNDYAEMRNVPEAQLNINRICDEKGEIERDYPYAGRCVSEIGNGEMKLTNKRMQKGCKIISDTFGFCIGETENCKTPIAVTGRVLAYPLESLKECTKHIGDFVCSGPNGTVSIMTSLEAIRHPESIIGTISEIPTYEIWHCGNKVTKPIQVNNRIWIYVR